MAPPSPRVALCTAASEIADDLREESAKWIELAESDLVAGTILKHAPGVLPSQSAFHFQQAIEKALKAVLILSNTDFPRTHDLVLLITLIKNNTAHSLPCSVDEFAGLNAYAVQTRYPGFHEPICESELDQAELTALRAVQWAAGLIQS